MHAVLIALHAAAGGVAFLTGLAAHRRRALFDGYLWSLVAAIVFLIAAVARDWSGLDAAARVVFVAFGVLGVIMIGLAVDARRQPPGSPEYVDRVGFTLVALFDAFAVITVLNAGAPVAAVVGAGVVVAIAGHFVLRWAKSRVSPTARPEATAAPAHRAPR